MTARSMPPTSIAGGPVHRYAASDFTASPSSPAGALIDPTADSVAADPSSHDLYVDDGYAGQRL